MPRYPLEFGWHTDQQPDTPEAPADTARIITPVAAGDLKCTGGSCSEGGDRGATGWFTFGGRIYCRQCMIKKLGLESESPAEQLKALMRHVLGGT